VVDYGKNRGQLSVERAWIASLAALVCAVTRRLSARRVDSRIAQSMVSLEAMFSEQGLYTGSLSSEDCSIRLAMERIASVLKGSDARQRFKLPERRDNLFHVRSTQVIQVLDTKRLRDTADMLLELAPDDIEKRQSPTDLPSCPSPGYDPRFILHALQKAATDASQSPKSAVLDLGALARTGLVDVAICGLASNSRQIRILAYAALAALARAVGPSGKVPPDFAAALYRDRRQLAYALELLQASIREPLVRVLPLFASFYCVALSVMLHPTHKGNKELVRFILRSSVQDVHDAEGVCYLLREPSQHCHELALQIMQRGIRSPEDHHVARRRRFYDRALTLLDLREYVVSALLSMVGRLNGQIAADLVRSLGILSWLMSAPTQDGANMNGTKDLELLTRLAVCLPEGALPSRYAPSFLQTLEVLSANNNADTTRVDEATAAVSRLTPRVLRLLDFDDRKYMRAGLVRYVHATLLQRATPELIQEAITACCTEGKKDRAFPNTKEDLHAIQAFIADQLLKNPRLRTNDVRSALACLALDGQRMTVWGMVASVSVLDQAALTPTLHQLAESIPGSVDEDALDLSLDQPWDSVLTDELKLSVSEMLLSKSASS
jgi:Nucleolar pre-ribosomal-associated protein 1